MKTTKKQQKTETTAPATAKPTGPSAAATLYRIGALCRAVEQRTAEATDKAALFAEYLAAIRDTTADYWRNLNHTAAA